MADPGRVLYDGRSAEGGHIRVTSQWCLVDDAGYPIVELRAVGVARGSRDVLDRRRIGVVGAVGGALVLVAAAIALGWTRQVWPAVAVALIGTVALTMLPAALDTVLRRPYEIWAEYRGAEVRLFVTEDREQHGKVARALVRALELHDR
jgi:hypothetical protein